MTSRERVLKALNHQEPDRVPLDLGGTIVTSIAATTLDRLRRHLGLEDQPVKVYDVYQMLGEVEMDLVERLGLDCVALNPPVFRMGLRNEGWKPWTLMDGTEVLMPGQFDIEETPEGDWLLHQEGDPNQAAMARMPAGGFYFDTIGYGDWHPDWQPPPLDDMRAQVEQAIVTDEELSAMAEDARVLHSETDKAVVLNALQYLGVWYVGTLPDFWCLLGSDPGYVQELFAIASERAMRNLVRLWEALGENVDVVAVSGLDFGTQRSEWFSPEVFKRVYVPPFRDQFQWIREHTTWKSFEHSCGSIPRLIGFLADAGLDALNPVQTSAAGMDPQWLKETFGDRITFWGGGVDTQSTLPFGTPEDVRSEVAERLRIFGPGGGFVFCPVHNIQPQTPPENIVAAYETALEMGKYPLAIR
jgi:hypothetical protein